MPTGKKKKLLAEIDTIWKGSDGGADVTTVSFVVIAVDSATNFGGPVQLPSFQYILIEDIKDANGKGKQLQEVQAQRPLLQRRMMAAFKVQLTDQGELKNGRPCCVK
jgi:hypothetical protein